LTRERYASLPDDVGVFRIARVGGGFLPDGHLMPKPEWLEPTKADQEEAKQTGRLPGTSVWEVPGGTHGAACWIRNADEQSHRSFVAKVHDVRTVATKHARELAVVADCLEHPEADARWPSLTDNGRELVRATCDAHALVEGIKRPAGTSEVAHRSFREEVARTFEPMPE